MSSPRVGRPGPLVGPARCAADGGAAGRRGARSPGDGLLTAAAALRPAAASAAAGALLWLTAAAGRLLRAVPGAGAPRSLLPVGAAGGRLGVVPVSGLTAAATVRVAIIPAQKDTQTLEWPIYLPGETDSS